MKKINHNKGFLVQGIIAVIALILVVGGAYYLGTSKGNVGPEGVVDKVNPPVEDFVPVQNNSDITSNWKTGTNSVIGFSYKYPKEWFVDDVLTTNNCCLNIRSYNTGAEKLFSGQTQIQIQRYTKSASQSLLAFVSLPDEMTGINPKVEQMTIAGIKGFKSNKLGDGIYYLPKSDTEGIVFISWSHPETRQASQKIAEQILSTFKFTN